ncbi:MAG: hypothetical protein WDZ91_03110 [Paenibacillaceae bacterium]
MRVLGWFSKLLLSVLLISFLSVFTTAYIIDLYINKFLEQWNVADTIKPSIDAEDYMSKLVNPLQFLNRDDSSSGDDIGLPVFNQGSVNELEQEDLQQSDPSTNGQSDDSTDQSANDQSNEPSIDPNDLTNQSTNPSTNDPINPSSNQSPTSSELKDTLVMSAQEFNEKRKKLTNKDKSAIFSIVITKFPQKELQKMSFLLEDGITEEELGDLEDVMNAYLEQEEVTKLLAILNKY